MERWIDLFPDCLPTVYFSTNTTSNDRGLGSRHLSSTYSTWISVLLWFCVAVIDVREKRPVQDEWL